MTIISTIARIPLKKWINPHSQWKSLKCSTWVQSLKNDSIISVHFQGKSFNITVIQVYAPTTNAEEPKVEWFYEDFEDLQDLPALTPKKKKTN